MLTCPAVLRISRLRNGNNSPVIVAILVAGGSGKRFGGRLPKQFLPLAGFPLLYWPLKRLCAERAIDRVVLLLPTAQLKRGAAMIAALPAPSQRKIILAAGGAERADSTLNGLAYCGADDLALVHDGARPLLSARDLKTLISAARKGPAVLGRPVTSTVKRLHDGRIRETVPRDALFIAETPQAAPAALLARAIRLAQRDGISATDEASYLERLGLDLTPVTARDPNPKITTPDDLALVRALIRNAK